MINLILVFEKSSLFKFFIILFFSNILKKIIIYNLKKQISQCFQMLNLKIAKKQKIPISRNKLKKLDDTINLIHNGTAREFTNSLCIEALNHKAVNHEYLKKMNQVAFKNKKMILRDYASQYSYYSSKFVIYLKNVINQLDNKKHKKILSENYLEEFGNPKSKVFEHLPHKKMFEIFSNEVGATTEYKKKNGSCLTSRVWGDLFNQKCKSKLPGVGIGAIGIGTEFIIPHIFSSILSFVKSEKSLSYKCSYFFELHTKSDIKHSNTLINCIEEIAENKLAREGLRFGAISALNLRKAFWDNMLARATNIEKNNN
tara:strand:+ start:3858 stop:4799 length:942 start_codon:yes stop_codon:yes gene_type:complete